MFCYKHDNPPQEMWKIKHLISVLLFKYPRPIILVTSGAFVTWSGKWVH